MSKKNHKHRKEDMNKGLEYMSWCPRCHAMGYFLKIQNPTNLVEEEAIICPSCRTDVYPIIKAFEVWQKDHEEAEEGSE